LIIVYSVVGLVYAGTFLVAIYWEMTTGVFSETINKVSNQICSDERVT
jgi:hypothetical protein